jgi:hypothetical protein
MHLVGFDGKDFMPYSSRLLPDLSFLPDISSAPHRTAYRFVERSGKLLRVAALTGSGGVLPATVRFDAYDTTPFQGDPEQLLVDWQKRLALKISPIGKISRENSSHSGIPHELTPTKQGNVR